MSNDKPQGSIFKPYGTAGCPECDDGRIGLWVKQDKCISCAPNLYHRENATTDILVSELNALRAELVAARDSFQTLSVAVNDKVEDKGATNFCLRQMDRINTFLDGKTKLGQGLLRGMREAVESEKKGE